MPVWTHCRFPLFRNSALLIGVRIMTFVKTFLRDDSGASAAEYALILAIVGAAIALAAITLGTTIGGALNEASTCISSNGKTCN